MIKLLLAIMLLLLNFKNPEPPFRKRDFVETYWFTENIDSLFYKSDTVLFIQHSNYGPSWAKDEFAEFELKYFGHGEFLNFGFKKKGEAYHYATTENAKQQIFTNHFTWSYDNKTELLSFYRDELLEFQLKPLLSRTVKIRSRFGEQQDSLLSTTELTLIKVKQ